MNTTTMFIGLGALFLGVLLGNAMDRGSGTARQETSESVAALQEQVAAMGDRMASIEEAVAAGDASRAALGERIDGAAASLSEKIDGVTSSLEASIAEAGSVQSEQFAALSESVSTAAASAAAAAASAASAGTTSVGAASAGAVAPSAAVDAVAPPADEAVSEMPAPEGTRAGETLALLDGAARVFVSGVDDETGTVRVAVNGQSLATLGGTDPVTFGVDDKDCTLNLDALDRGHAKMSADCVDAAAEEPAAPAPTVTASAEAIAAGSDAKGPGQTAWLLDGKARVFVSGVDAEAGTARVAINGLSTAILGGSRPVTFQADGGTCTLQLDDIVEGRVQMSATCN